MKAVFRCDATEHLGFGHLSRCMALAETLKLSGVDSTFAGKFDPAALDQIGIAGFDSIPFADPVNTAPADAELGAIPSLQSADFIVIDSYRADEQYLRALASLFPATVVIDDFCKLRQYPCDAVLNFTWEASDLGYPSGPTLILGPNNLLARRKLIDRRQTSVARDRSGPIGNLLIAIGGTDPKGITARIVRLLHGKGTEICLRTISADTSAISGLLTDFATGSRALTRQPDLSGQLLWADAAITGGGLIKYESAYMGVPAAAIAQNEGQDGETQVFAKAGLVFDLGLADSVSDDELAHNLNTFISDAALRGKLTQAMQAAFVPDPAAHAANAILEAVRR